MVNTECVAAGPLEPSEISSLASRPEPEPPGPAQLPALPSRLNNSAPQDKPKGFP